MVNNLPTHVHTYAYNTTIMVKIDEVPYFDYILIREF
jgi:hypothetical protein